jgi:general secretion pathway protein I
MQRGFSLLEVLAAFVILALVATALFRLFGGALGNAGVAEDASRAVLIAQSRLDAARGEMRGGSTSGTEQDRYEWTTRIEPWEAPDAAAAQSSGVAPLLTPTQLFRITVQVKYPGAGGRDRALELSSLRLARREGAP